MKRELFYGLSLGAVIFLTGCETVPPGVERGPHGTIAYDVLVEASEPGARIEANGENLGDAPLHLKIFGEKDGLFHDFGAYYYVIRAYPLTSNQFVQTRVFLTGHEDTPQDQIPRRIYFDMNQKQPEPPAGSTAYPPPVYYRSPPVYFGPPPYYYGPQFRFFIGPPYHRYRRW